MNSLTLKNYWFNHWNYPCGPTTSEETAVQQILENSHQLASQGSPKVTPLVSLNFLNGRKVEVLVDTRQGGAAYILRADENSTSLSGAFKQGIPVTRLPSQPQEKHILLTNKEQSPLNFQKIQEDMNTVDQLSCLTTKVKKYVASHLHWFTQSREEHIGFVAIRQEQDLFRAFSEKVNCSRPMDSRFECPLDNRRSMQLEMLQTFEEISNAGFRYPDIKPDNILVSGLNTDNPQATVCDFDMCFKNPGSIDRLCGNIHFSAPEYLALCRIAQQMKGERSFIPGEVVSLCMQDKNGVFSLGLCFLIMSLDDRNLQHLYVFIEDLLNNLPEAHHLREGPTLLPESFTNTLSQLCKDAQANPDIPQQSSSALQRAINLLDTLYDNTPKLPKPLSSWDALLQRMLDPNPLTRYSFKEAREALEQLIQHERSAC